VICRIIGSISRAEPATVPSEVSIDASRHRQPRVDLESRELGHAIDAMERAGHVARERGLQKRG
jgi:hypothetical protein